MSVSEKDVQYIANLARLQVTNEEARSYAKDMSSILEYMDLLNEVDTSNIEPLEHVIDLESRFRKDEAKEPLSHEDALKNAPDADSDYFRVPKVIE
ncbi:MAG TPA: Asp-tRNA(Asn)/Glu-tRNA(Gln) amidotransferase GatCAB subunit C [Balneola sp.]|jgi:aspartyl-tRNA(Asn)/glutamyl-tRNA(Gln) amidotransferase subunit C|nr:Asp-tRNA(Asn)/Glu-tRNA(Gln) amidotransferase GatCAB subunit C [Balneola sp.]MAO78669.1 Asp-tRNA(Asn)/Glu-tRNA(Gln) amidotransferase GatCAB subunit C [Balneola sp.]MBF63103.1 Asp-tRNA(Asn)/Glu-tRNA(Gln) amidotransferase GatCAB subunit C [Balneola sp.]HAH49896.1 Asp-tRNA(Asn)/Glu-tRNA(Gln) amidotransferase GatCAB subunit C [Balneola sp.]HAW79852.1 Asp-tRNA(Asn)/Glu-tRNA(Gln) amidotransferase GatCAB subunit C [Balneola sp.]|tara:strand:- start:37117 stop:37404 length:288 start_codon:yes stop_codon:yes gene_type:complete